MQIQISTYVDIRATYVVQTYLLLVHNFYPYAEQQSIPILTLWDQRYCTLYI